MRVSLGTGGKIMEKDDAVGQNIRVTVVKNKTAAPYKKAEFKVFFDGRKVDEVTEVAEIAADKGLFTRVNKDGDAVKTGLFFTWPSVPEFRARGKGELAQALRDCPQVLEEIKTIIAEGSFDEHAVKYGASAEDEDDFDALTGGEDGWDVVDDPEFADDDEGAEGDDGEE